MDKHLKELEEKSISVIREAKARFSAKGGNIAMLWSMGKDSTVTLGLARKAFLGHIPFPVIHIDNGIDFPETYELRERVSKEWGFEMVVEKSIVKQDKISGVDCCGANKTDALKKVMEERKIDALIVSIRRDEHGIRAKERYFSPRDKDYKWDYKNQAPEIWDYLSDFPDSDHVRVHPLLHWQELDVWKYLKAENLPVNPPYFSRNGERFRSLGCTKCTVAMKSEAKTIDEIIAELEKTTDSERGGRAQDKEKEYVMQQLRALGYM